ncbi:MAG: flagellar biosynthesis protein FlgB [Hyphomonadaceae bacterium]|nr:MAG: flagellar basal-body rod protein FlgB [Caulobacteraceae bacterium]MBT9445327.1 flagellar biosynthesis protein FlgB [Hyphomonadaceae bacterium]TPW04679.1 MAG: flagellar basal-body rod protein FlgB [Alphaproteobacteria bacterium]
MDPLSVALVGKALDGLFLRSSYIAQNLANVNTPDYQSVDVNFEAHLAAAAQQGAGAVRRTAPQLRNVGSAGEEVRIDLELAKASETTLRYTALVEVLTRQAAIAQAVASSQGR